MMHASRGPVGLLTSRISSLGSLILAATLLLAAPAAAQESVAGTWIFTVSSPDGAGMMEIPFVFEQSGTEVTGTVDLSVIPEVQATEITDGEFVDGILFFLLHVGAGGEWLTAEVEAEVEGDEMTGEVYLPDMGQVQPFTAKKSG